MQAQGSFRQLRKEDRRKQVAGEMLKRRAGYLRGGIFSVQKSGWSGMKEGGTEASEQV